jgi:queuosine precursor transporter
MKNNSIYNTFVFISYIAAIIIADVTATMPLNLPFGLITTVGTLVFGLTFTLRDELHSQGLRKVYFGIAIASLLALVVNFVLGLPLQIIFASLVAFVFSETLDTQAFQNFRSQNWLYKCLFSNFLSVPFDAVVFNLFAFWNTPLQPIIWQLIISQVVFKYIVATILAFTIYSTKKTFDN